MSGQSSGEFAGRRRLRAGILLLSVTVLAACQDSAGDDGGGSAGTSLFDPSVFSAFFVDDFGPYEADARALRENDPKYLVQKFSWIGDDGTVYDSYSLDNANVEYAHAAGLTGAGQTIAILDAGFRQSHVEFAGKTIYTPPDHAPGVDDHGTGVASIAAGSATSGEMIGVAPGADLQLGAFDSFESMAAATRQAASVGAIVQNNSWGYEADATRSQYDAVFGSPGGTDYINALRDFAGRGIVVFAASNTVGRTRADLVSALPNFVSGLEASFITVVNAVPGYANGEIASASLVSSACLEAARWCMAADGTVYAAQAYTYVTDSEGNIISSTPSDTAYGIVSGTSFAAPQVAGAIALLAEAFPSLSAQELRARLLASANNSFFPHTGYVDFASTVRHGYNEELGHGFLDLKAALMPIGGSYLPQSNGTMLSADRPVVLGGALSGDALSTRLAREEIVIVDALGGDFAAPGNIMAADMLLTPGPEAAIARVMAADLAGDEGDPFALESAFPATVPGRELSRDLGDVRLSLFMPSERSRSASFGISASRRFDLGGSALRLGFGLLREEGAFAGIQAMQGARLSAQHASASFAWDIPLNGRERLSLAGSLGVAAPGGDLPGARFTPVSYGALRLSYAARDVLGRGDRLSVALGMPQAITSGQARFELPVTMRAGQAGFAPVAVPLSPARRQTDFTASYGLSLSDGAELLFSARRSLNLGNVAGRRSSDVAMGLRISF